MCTQKRSLKGKQIQNEGRNVSALIQSRDVVMILALSDRQKNKQRNEMYIIEANLMRKGSQAGSCVGGGDFPRKSLYSYIGGCEGNVFGVFDRADRELPCDKGNTLFPLYFLWK